MDFNEDVPQPNSEAAPVETAPSQSVPLAWWRGFWVSPRGRIWAGVLVSNGAAAAACLLAPWAMKMLSQLAGSTVPVAATLSFALGLPVCMGFIGAWFWRHVEGRSASGFAFVNTLFSWVPAALVLHEGLICLVMAFPLLWLLEGIGTAIGLAFWRSAGRLQATLLPAFLLLPALDAALCATGGERLFRDSVTTQVTIRARPAQIYRYLAAFPPIEEPADFWLWRLGAPAPLVSRAQGSFVGARRECVLARNIVIAERITRAEPGRALEFRVTQMPRDPEIFGHLWLFRGGFEIVPHRDGTCTLVGRTDYGLATRPGWYYNWWTQSVIHAVHRRVLGHIRALAERDAALPPQRAAPPRSPRF